MPDFPDPPDPDDVLDDALHERAYDEADAIVKTVRDVLEATSLPDGNGGFVHQFDRARTDQTATKVVDRLLDAHGAQIDDIDDIASAAEWIESALYHAANGESEIHQLTADPNLDDPWERWAAKAVQTLGHLVEREQHLVPVSDKAAGPELAGMFAKATGHDKEICEPVFRRLAARISRVYGEALPSSDPEVHAAVRRALWRTLDEAQWAGGLSGRRALLRVLHNKLKYEVDGDAAKSISARDLTGDPIAGGAFDRLVDAADWPESSEPSPVAKSAITTYRPDCDTPEAIAADVEAALRRSADGTDAREQIIGTAMRAALNPEHELSRAHQASDTDDRAFQQWAPETRYEPNFKRWWLAKARRIADTLAADQAKEPDDALTAASVSIETRLGELAPDDEQRFARRLCGRVGARIDRLYGRRIADCVKHPNWGEYADAALDAIDAALDEAEDVAERTSPNVAQMHFRVALDDELDDRLDRAFPDADFDDLDVAEDGPNDGGRLGRWLNAATDSEATDSKSEFDTLAARIDLDVRAPVAEAVAHGIARVDDLDEDTVKTLIDELGPFVDERFGWVFGEIEPSEHAHVQTAIDDIVFDEIERREGEHRMSELKSRVADRIEAHVEGDLGDALSLWDDGDRAWAASGQDMRSDTKFDRTLADTWGVGGPVRTERPDLSGPAAEAIDNVRAHMEVGTDIDEQTADDTDGAPAERLFEYGRSKLAAVRERRDDGATMPQIVDELAEQLPATFDEEAREQAGLKLSNHLDDLESLKSPDELARYAIRREFEHSSFHPGGLREQIGPIDEHRESIRQITDAVASALEPMWDDIDTGERIAVAAEVRNFVGAYLWNEHADAAFGNFVDGPKGLAATVADRVAELIGDLAGAYQRSDDPRVGELRWAVRKAFIVHGRSDDDRIETTEQAAVDAVGFEGGVPENVDWAEVYRHVGDAVGDLLADDPDSTAFQSKVYDATLQIMDDVRTGATDGAGSSPRFDIYEEQSMSDQTNIEELSDAELAELAGDLQTELRRRQNGGMPASTDDNALQEADDAGDTFVEAGKRGAKGGAVSASLDRLLDQAEAASKSAVSEEAEEIVDLIVGTEAGRAIIKFVAAAGIGKLVEARPEAVPHDRKVYAMSEIVAERVSGDLAEEGVHAVFDTVIEEVSNIAREHLDDEDVRQVLDDDQLREGIEAGEAEPDLDAAFEDGAGAREPAEEAQAREAAPAPDAEELGGEG